VRAKSRAAQQRRISLPSSTIAPIAVNRDKN